MANTEWWQRGPIDGVPAVLQPIAHILLQVRESVGEIVEPLTEHEWNARPARVASAAFHVRHIAGVIDRLFTYARGNALTLTGSFQTGSGFNDQYSGLNGGSSYPVLTPAYVPNIDPGLVTYDPTGKLHTINWMSFLAGVQYYLPPSGNVFVSVNVAQMKSDNIASFLVAPGATATAAQLGTVFNKVQWGDANLFWNVTPALRFGAEYAYYRQTYADGVVVKNHRAQFSGFLLF